MEAGNEDEGEEDDTATTFSGSEQDELGIAAVPPPVRRTRWRAGSRDSGESVPVITSRTWLETLRERFGPIGSRAVDDDNGSASPCNALHGEVGVLTHASPHRGAVHTVRSVSKDNAF